MRAASRRWRNAIAILSAVGATPLAVTNCLNFASPQRPEIMAQLTGCLEGMGDACRALDFPIVSGNVSLYNESKATGGGNAILPTPAIGGVGLLADWSKSATIAFKAEGEAIWLIGEPQGTLANHFGFEKFTAGKMDPPPVRSAGRAIERQFVRGAIQTVSSPPFTTSPTAACCRAGRNGACGDVWVPM